MLSIMETTTSSDRYFPLGAIPPVCPVLVVEDHPEIRSLIQCIRESDGLAVETAEDGLQGLTQACARRPALVILDLNLPLLDGESVARELRSTYGSTIPIILVSANDDLPDVADRVGAAAWLAKPFTVQGLREPVRRVLAAVAS